MNSTRYLLFLLFGLSLSLQAQPLLEDLSIGIGGRTEQNIYRYYHNQGIGNYNTLRVSNGYSAGIMLHSSINYLFSGGLGLSMSEAHYSPDLERNGSVLWTSQLRLWQLDLWGELKLSQNEKSHPLLMLGIQGMFIDYKRELYNTSSSGDADIYAWPQQRYMPKFGLGYYQEIGRKLRIMPSFGMRLALTNKVGYDYVFNQFFAGINIAYRVKSW